MEGGREEDERERVRKEKGGDLFLVSDDLLIEVGDGLGGPLSTGQLVEPLSQMRRPLVHAHHLSYH